MPLVQQNTGTWTGTTFTATLPSASSSANCVVLIVAGNTTVTTPTNWRTTGTVNQVNQMGHYLYDRQGVALSSVTVTTASGQGTWFIAEISGGVYNTGLGQNNTTGAASYSTASLTPAAGTRLLIASIGSSVTGGAQRTVSGWTNGFVEVADVCYSGADAPMQGVAILDNVAATGSTAYSTTATYSSVSSGRSALIASYATGAAVVSTRYRQVGKRR